MKLVRKQNLGLNALYLTVFTAVICGASQYLILPSAQDFVSQARLCNDEFLVCSSSLRPKIFVKSLNTSKQYDLGSILSNMAFHWPAEFEVSKRSPCMIVRVDSNPNWILVNLDDDSCQRVSIPLLNEIQLIDDFNADRTLLVGNDPDGKQSKLILSDENTVSPEEMVDLDPVRFRAVVKTGAMHFESSRFLPSTGCLVEEIGDSLAHPPWRNLVLTNAVTGHVLEEVPIVPPKTLGLIAVGNHRLLAISREGQVTHCWSVDESGKLRKQETNEGDCVKELDEGGK